MSYNFDSSNRSYLKIEVDNGKIVMEDDEKLFSIAQTAKKLGGISRNIVMKEINEGKLKACRRGKRMFCTQAQINEYKKNQLIDMIKIDVDFANYPEIVKVPV